MPQGLIMCGLWRRIPLSSNPWVISWPITTARPEYFIDLKNSNIVASWKPWRRHNMEPLSALPVTGILNSQRVNIVELWCFVCCWFEQIVKQTPKSITGEQFACHICEWKTWKSSVPMNKQTTDKLHRSHFTTIKKQQYVLWRVMRIGIKPTK